MSACLLLYKHRHVRPAPRWRKSRARRRHSLGRLPPLRFREETTMPRAAVTTLLSLSRRRGYGYAAAAAEARAPGAGGAADGAASSSKEVFWMRDPQTGCWAPEDRFADVDAAELRARLLARKD